MKNALLIILVFMCLNLKSQPMTIDYFEFIDYSTVINNLENYGVKSKYFQNLDYESMLYLNKSSIKTMLKVNPDFLKENCIDTSDIFREQEEKFTYRFKSHSIRDFFNYKDFFRSSINKIIHVENWELGNQIYLKDNRVAIFSINGQYEALFKASLHENEVKIELLYELIE